ncbi:MAG: hypothetical protein NC089_01065 [Bacteroides sp.]|nr:hypothetical protein [Bacteroides sp.]MCM1549803.1 hypothetical protein [Clostridium sp.]
MQSVFLILLLAFLLLGMLFHVPLVIEGAHTGLELWYESVLPSILPFMIITNLLLQRVHGKGICYLGLFCGLPVGANLVNQQTEAGQIAPADANVLLCICNITSPMFISGYILHQSLHNQISALRFFLVIYLPLLLYGLSSMLRSRWRRTAHRQEPNAYTSTPIAPKAPKSLEAVLLHSLQVILMVGVYIMLFCILIQFLLHYIPSAALIPKLLTSTLEITNGIHVLLQLPIDFQQKTALIAGLTSFGGICSLLQTKSVLTDTGLSIIHYTAIKLCMGGMSYLLALLLL